MVIYAYIAVFYCTSIITVVEFEFHVVKIYMKKVSVELHKYITKSNPIRKRTIN